MKKKTFKKKQLLHLRSIETTPSTEYSLMPGMIWNLTRYHHAHMHAHTSKHAHTRLCENKMPSVPHVFEINLSLGGFLLSWSGWEGTDFHRLNRFPWTFVWTTFNTGYMVSFFQYNRILIFVQHMHITIYSVNFLNFTIHWIWYFLS